MNGSEERRKHFRLRYPDDARPAVIIEGRACALTELSARGIRALVPEPGWSEGSACDLVLAFASHPGVRVLGAVVLRRDGDEIAFWFNEDLDHALVLREQRRLIRRARRLGDPTALAALRTWPPR